MENILPFLIGECSLECLLRVSPRTPLDAGIGWGGVREKREARACEGGRQLDKKDGTIEGG